MNAAPMPRLLLALVALLVFETPVAADERTTISPAQRDESGFLTHEVVSPYQAGKTHIRVLLPEPLDPRQRYPAIYVLPVEERDGDEYGNGLIEVKQHRLANEHQAIFVAPTFSHVPWFADHPSDPTIRQETYLVDVVVPYVDKTYPVRHSQDGRLLLGFSKSAWGAWTLLLRHPDVFGRAAAWDGPMMMDHSGPFGSGAIFDTQENFAKYHVSRLLGERAATLRDGKRLILMGYSGFPQGHEKMHALLDELEIPHEYRDGPKRKHDWHSGWVSEAVDLLLPTGGGG